VVLVHRRIISSCRIGRSRLIISRSVISSFLFVRSLSLWRSLLRCWFPWAAIRGI